MFLRMMIKPLAALLLLAGCVSSHQANQDIQGRVVGLSVDDFVMRYGPPYSRYDMADGRKVYRWGYDRGTYTTPAVTTGALTDTGDGTLVYDAQTVGGGTKHQGCDIQFTADQAGKIVEAHAVRDSLGVWTTSYCHEFFD